MSSPSERAALKRRAKLDSQEAEAIRQGISAEREKAISDVEESAQKALTLTKPLAPPASAPLVSSLFRSFLEDESGRDESGMNRIQRIMRNMSNIAESSSPKAVEASKFLTEYAYGKAKPSDEALDAMAKGGVQIVYIEAPQVPLAEARKELPAAPDFVNAEFTEDTDE